MSESPSSDRGRVLLAAARAALERAFDGRPPEEMREEWLHRAGACFVTLKQGGELRGCIGSVEAHRPLLDDLRHNAEAAAFRDPRFPPLERDELAGTSIEVSLLAPPSPLHFAGEADLLRQLVPGEDGLVLEHGRHRGVFLPAVWRALPEREEFWRQLKVKAGLPAGFWADDVEVWRFGVESWAE